MADRICSLDGCGEKYYARDLCRTHWKRWRKHGDPGPAQRLRMIPPPECLADDCVDPPRARGYCVKHYQRWQKFDDANHEVHGSSWRGDDVGYIGLHQRIYQIRGSAAEHACQQCGAQAEEWAYDHTDPHQKLDPKRGPYSLNPRRYVPLCVLCHRRADRKRLK